MNAPAAHRSIRAMDAPRIGFIGLGRMGQPMARRLVQAGYGVTGYDVRNEALAAARRDGAAAASGVADAVRGADVLITMLPDGRAVEAVVYGEPGLLSAVRPGQTLLEMTSSHPDVTRRVAADLAGRGIGVLDAPVSGGVRGAEQGTLCVMVGGPAPLLEAQRPLLECFGRIVHVGDAPGDGDVAKTINNLMSATTIWSAVEAITLARRAGLEPERFLEAINRSTGRSYTTEQKVAQYMLPRRFAAGFTVAQYLKDLDICLDVAAGLDAPMLLGEALRQAWRAAAQSGLAAEDHTALITLLERWAGLDGRESPA
ncbi:MAG TPA: NAD(P)-dependent oxidoreductase [bacterium]|nr:NAD(P)-dependent oxidoreductase [bacterium]